MAQDGSVDTAFDGPSGTGNGYWLISDSAGGDELRDMAFDDRGGVVFTGVCSTGASTDACSGRIDAATGALDPAFDGPAGTGNGFFKHGVGSSADRMEAIVPASDGSYLVAGYCTGASNQDFCVARYAGGATIDDYLDVGGGSDRDWSSAVTTSLFGACLRAVANDAVGDWTIPGSCAATDAGGGWNAIGATGSTVAHAGSVGDLDGEAHLRFGTRPATGQAIGHYVAPITFDVLAP
jgi:hypothetical protein